MLDMQWWANLAQVVTGAVAVAALWVAVWQIQRSHRAQQEATSYATFGEQLRQNVAKPDFAKGEYRPEQKDEYDDFVTHLLYSCENILETNDEPLWRNTVQFQLGPHRAFLRDEFLTNKAKVSCYTPAVVRIIQEIVGRPATGPSPSATTAYPPKI
jgi:hypothetical protein